MSFDSRVIGNIFVDPKQPDYCPEVHGLAASNNGYALRFGLETYVEPSTRSGRKYARTSAGAELIGVYPIDGTETILAISREVAKEMKFRKMAKSRKSFGLPWNHPVS